MDLVIFLAGKSTRFGSLKQYTPIDYEGNFVCDYNIKNAKEAGFKRVICVINFRHFPTFYNTIYKRWKNKIDIVVAFQSYKRYGTRSACIKAIHKVKDTFMTINGDDLYPIEYFKQALETKPYSCILTTMNNTFFRNTVGNRGIAIIYDGFIKSVNEERIVYEVGQSYNPTVSINIFILDKNILSDLRKTKNEVLAECINELILNKEYKFKALTNNVEVFGLTYKEDLLYIKEYVKK